MAVKDVFLDVPKKDEAKAWLFWLTMAAMGTGLVVSLRQLRRGM